MAVPDLRFSTALERYGAREHGFLRAQLINDRGHLSFEIELRAAGPADRTGLRHHGGRLDALRSGRLRSQVLDRTGQKFSRHLSGRSSTISIDRWLRRRAHGIVGILN